MAMLSEVNLPSARSLVRIRRLADWLGADVNCAPPYIRGILTEAERGSEILLAYLRLAAFTILLLLFRGFEFSAGDRGAIILIGLYGVATAASIVLAWWRFYKRWLPWAFTTADILLVVGFVAMLTVKGKLTTAEAFSAPGGMMIFLFMAHAAVRYRPALILYAAALFLFTWLISDAIDREPALSYPMLLQKWAWVGIVMLTAVTLYVIAVRTRLLLLTSIKDAYLRTSLSRFVPLKLVQELADRGDIAAVCRQQQAAVLFADIRGFTAVAEQMPPAAVLDFLNEYRHRMSIVIATHAGTVDKFIGDAVMVVFGIPQPGGDDARRTVNCALAMLQAVEDWNHERLAAGVDTVRIGIGAHYGEVIVGAIGDDRRLEYTVIGDTVNAAQRIERLCAELDLSLLVSAELLGAAEITERGWRPISAQKVRGRQQQLHLFAPSSLRPDDDDQNVWER